MVQSGKHAFVSSSSCGDWDKSSRKSGFEALQKKQEEQKKAEKDKYGAWGPTFKNKQHFTSMHLC